ncbi:hypothetical protein [Candidatus Methylocalor cossyra]|uniref:Cytochrome b561 bacterial/Ni-hydrogenase domain-containing protein n=1 Tax=Candidatus Methylocalor cossyra TaxID=3108543 RepID=A0ABP1C722_9GAMM
MLAKRFLAVLGLTVAAVLASWSLEALLGLSRGWPFGHTQAGHLVGWVGLVMILLTFGYPVRKRRGPKAAWPKGWFLVHQLAGIFGPLLILVHSGAHFHAWVPILAMLAMGVVAVSGVIGVAVHRRARRMLGQERRRLLGEGLSPAEVEGRVFDLASAEEAFRVWQIIHAPMVVLFLALALAHVLGAWYFGGV